jgi:hypothetical protein
MPLIKDCLESVINKCDKIIVIDGKYTDYPGDISYSTDGTIEYILSMQKVCNLQLFFGNITDEVGKRNQYLDLVDENDIVLNLDSDEVLIGDIPELTADFGVLDLHDMVGKHVQHRANRLFKFKDGMEYKNTHCTLYFQGKIINKLQEIINPDFTHEHITSCYIEHYWNKRDDLRKYNKGLYYKKLVQSEAGQIK